MYDDKRRQDDPADAPAADGRARRGAKAIGVKGVTLHRPGYFDLVCEELCGQGHYKMQGRSSW